MSFSIAKKLVDELAKTTHTPSLLYYRLELLKEFFETIVFAPESEKKPDMRHLRAFLLGKREEEHTVQALSALSPETFRALSGKNLYTIIGEAKEYIKQFPHVLLYVPVDLPLKDIERIGGWFRQNVNPSLLVSLRIDPLVVGGCAFVWNDTYYNFSLDYFLRKKHDKVVQSIHELYGNYTNKTSASR